MASEYHCKMYWLMNLPVFLLLLIACALMAGEGGSTFEELLAFLKLDLIFATKFLRIHVKVWLLMLLILTVKQINLS